MRLNVRWAAALAAGLVAVPTAAHAKPVSPEQFGLHVASLGAGATPSVSVNSVRLWDAGVRWDEINPKKGQYNWAPLDRAVSAAETAGATEILYVLARPLVGGEHLLRRRPLRSWHSVVPQEEQVLSCGSPRRS